MTKRKLQFSLRFLFILMLVVGLTGVATHYIWRQQQMAHAALRAAVENARLANIFELQVQRQQLLKSYGMGHPSVQKIDAEIRALELQAKASLGKNN